MTARLRLPVPVAWITKESEARLTNGGNSRNVVPAHAKQSHVSKIPLYTEQQLAEHAAAAIVAFNEDRLARTMEAYNSMFRHGGRLGLPDPEAA